MIRTTVEAPFFGLWRDPALLSVLAHPQYLTTARYEPILRNRFGSGHIDLLFESADQSCILGALRLDASHLVTRERSPFVWPSILAKLVDHAQLCAIESTILPWLRSLARARPMANESIRRFAPSDRFDRARDAGLAGAAPLDLTLVRMAPFVYARRFAAGGHVLIACADGALAQAVLGDVAKVIEQEVRGGDDEAFSRAWYGTPPPRLSLGTPDVVITDRYREDYGLAVVVELQPSGSRSAAIIDVPSPVPWDLLFSFNGADAPIVSRFGVHAAELPMRTCEQLAFAEPAVGGSSGTIVLAVSAEALTMRGDEIEEAEILGRRLVAEGFDVDIVSDVSEKALSDAGLIHIFGARFDPHTLAFAEFALQRSIDYVFDLPPLPADPSTLHEYGFSILNRSALDDADIARYMSAFSEGKLTLDGSTQTTAEEYTRADVRFSELARSCAAVLTIEEDLDLVRAALPKEIAERIRSRGVFAQAEPVAGATGHLVAGGPFALMHAAIAERSHLLYAAVAAERAGVPLVITGPVYDVDYLQTLRKSAPNAIVLADADARTISALYRRATIWVDASPRPRSAARLLRAVACGALPVIPADSPLSRIAAGDALTFSLTSIDDCADKLSKALVVPDRWARVEALQVRLVARRDPETTFRSVIAAYSLAATTV